MILESQIVFFETEYQPNAEKKTPNLQFGVVRGKSERHKERVESSEPYLFVDE
jgi:hypothetical protein